MTRAQEEMVDAFVNALLTHGPKAPIGACGLAWDRAQRAMREVMEELEKSDK